MKCERPWCDPPGEIEGGYCNRCGSPPEAAPASLSLAACESYANGVVYLAYRPGA